MAFLRGSGPVLRFRGRKRVVDLPLTKREILLIAISMLILAMVLLLAMYIGWWTMQEEEREWEHHDAARVERAKYCL
jgi:hypothetical protein